MFKPQIISVQPKLKNTAKQFLVCSVSVFACLLFLTSFLALGFGGNLFDNNPFDDTVFNQSQWKSDQNCSNGSNRRGHMAQDIVRHHLQRGMSQQKVAQLLGEPTQYSASEFAKYYGNGSFYFSEMISPNDKQSTVVWRYYLGEELDMAWGIDHADLYVYFRDGQYTGSRIGWPK